MSPPEHAERDELDQRIGKLLRSTRAIAVARPVPAPRPGEPDDDELLLLLDGRASAEQAEQLEGRLQHHPYSAARVDIVRAALRDVGLHPRVRLSPEHVEERAPDTAGSLTKLVFAAARGGRRALRFLRGTEQPSALGSLALATRGAPTTATERQRYRLERSFSNLTAVLDVEQADDGQLELHLELEPDDGGRASGTRVSLREHDRLVSSIKLRGDDRSASFSQLDLGDYRLELSRDGQPIGTMVLSFLSLDPPSDRPDLSES